MIIREVEDLKSSLIQNHSCQVTHYGKDTMAGYWIYFRTRTNTAEIIKRNYGNRKAIEFLGDDEYRISTKNVVSDMNISSPVPVG
jgi:hypothetical protein